MTTTEEESNRFNAARLSILNSTGSDHPAATRDGEVVLSLAEYERLAAKLKSLQKRMPLSEMCTSDGNPLTDETRARLGALLELAASLWDGEVLKGNEDSEYLRGQIEMTAYATGVDMDTAKEHFPLYIFAE